MIWPDADIDSFSQPPIFQKYSFDKATSIIDIVPTQYKILTIHADTLPEKMWPKENFISFINNFLKVNENYVIFIIGLKDIGLMENEFQSRVVSCIGLSLDVSIAIVSQSYMFVGVDSCMLHVADVFKIPSVAIFVSTNEKEFGFRINTKYKIMSSPKSGNALCYAVQDLISKFDL
jgi:ADP-heptose:LPS heptosyltransferase